MTARSMHNCLLMSVIVMEEYNVMVNSEELIGSTEYLTLQAGYRKKG